MTAATVNVTSDFTTTPSAPLVVVEFTAPSDDATPTIALPSTGDGKTWRPVGGVNGASGTPVGFTISGNTATVTQGMSVSERGAIIITKS